MMAPIMALSADEQVCIERLLGAPIEKLPDWRGKRRGDPWYAVSLGFGRAYATWSGHPFSS